MVGLKTSMSHSQCMLSFKIVDPSGDLKDGQIYDSNRSTILTALKDQGFCASDMGIARDRLVVGMFYVYAIIKSFTPHLILFSCNQKVHLLTAVTVCYAAVKL